MKIVQVKGSNGSGKTTLVKELGLLSEDWTYLTWDGGKVYATVFDNIRWAAIGKYDPNAAMGGCDCLGSVDEIKRAIQDVMRYRKGYWIVFEGMMISTIKSTFYNFLLDIEAKGKAKVLFVILKSTAEGCITRIRGRGTMRADLQVDNVAAKCDMVIRHAQTYDPDHVRWINVENTPKEALMPVFLFEVDDTELIDAIYDQPEL